MTHNETVLRAGVLGRVSHSDRKGGPADLERSVTEQLDENRQAASDHDWAVAQVYADAVSASRFARTARQDWPRLLADIASGQLDIVIMWETSRASRELEDWARFLTLCRKNGVQIYVTLTERLFDPSNAQDWKTLADAGVVNAYASEETSARTKRGKRSNARHGKPSTRCPYGYTRTYTVGNLGRPQLESQTIVAGQASVVVELIQRVAGEEPISAIVADLNARRIPVPGGEHSRSGQWTRESLRRMVRNVSYLGKTVSGGTRLSNGKTVGGQLVQAVWPPISGDPDWAGTWYAANAVLDRPERKTTRPGSGKYLLSFLATCGACGAHLNVGNARRAGGGWAAQYRCSEHHCVAAPVAAMDEFVSAVVVARMSKPDMLAGLVTGTDEAAAGLRAEVAELTARKNEAADAYAAGKLSLDGLTRIEESLAPRIELASRRAAELAVPVPLRELAGPGDVAARWKALPLAARREVVRALFVIPPVLGQGREGGGRQGRVIPLLDRVSFPAWEAAPEAASEAAPEAAPL